MTERVKAWRECWEWPPWRDVVPWIITILIVVTAWANMRAYVRETARYHCATTITLDNAYRAQPPPPEAKTQRELARDISDLRRKLQCKEGHQ